MISVIVPVYNSEKTLRFCLDSILAQSGLDFEVILVDNGSTDQTPWIIEEYSKAYEKISSIQESRRSRGLARNRGIEKARGDIIVMTDADCVVPENWLQNLTQPLREEQEDVVMGWEREVDSNYWSSRIQEGNKAYLDRNTKGKYINSLDTKNFAIRTEVMKKYMFDETIGNLEDYELALRLRDRYRIRFLADVCVTHHHKRTLFSWLSLSMNRGMWARRIYEKHKDKDFIHQEPMYETIALGNFIKIMVWQIWGFLRRPNKKIWFIFISEVGWRIGLLRGRL